MCGTQENINEYSEIKPTDLERRRAKREGLSESAVLDRLGKKTRLSKDLLKFLSKKKLKRNKKFFLFFHLFLDLIQQLLIALSFSRNTLSCAHLPYSGKAFTWGLPSLMDFPISVNSCSISCFPFLNSPVAFPSDLASSEFCLRQTGW